MVKDQPTSLLKVAFITSFPSPNTSESNSSGGTRRRSSPKFLEMVKRRTVTTVSSRPIAGANLSPQAEKDQQQQQRQNVHAGTPKHLYHTNGNNNNHSLGLNRNGEPSSWRRARELGLMIVVLVMINVAVLEWTVVPQLTSSSSSSLSLWSLLGAAIPATSTGGRTARLQSMEDESAFYSHQPLPWYSAAASLLSTSSSTDRYSTAELLLPPLSSLSLGPGDLPGYTGWARPVFTLAPWFEPVSVPHHAVVGQPYVATIECQGHPLCWAGKDRASLFDVRAYGPAIVTGPVQEVFVSNSLGEPSSSRRYKLSLQFLDAGVYTLEWVLALSVPPIPMDGYPIFGEPAYEGYLLPGFPMTVVVVDPFNQDQYSATWSMSAWKQYLSWLPPWRAGYHELEEDAPEGEDRGAISLPPCQASDILDQSLTSALEKARWVLQEKVPTRSFQLSPTKIPKEGDGEHDQESNVDQPDSSVSLLGYQQGLHSIGFRMAYLHEQCALPSMTELKPAMDSRRRHIVFLGDSNMVRQQYVFDNQGYQQVNATFISVLGGLVNVMPKVKETFAELKKRQEQETEQVSYHIIFNSGLHDIAQMCTAGRGKRYARAWNTTMEGLPRCAASYRRLLTELAAMIKEFPAQTKVFQTTTAGWPKWGNYGFAWPPSGAQTFPQSPQYVEYFNTIAWEVIQGAGIPVVDAFWKTLARPDHREVVETNEIGKHLVHGGPEIYDLLVREFFQLIVQNDATSIFPEVEKPLLLPNENGVDSDADSGSTRKNKSRKKKGGIRKGRKSN